MVPMCTIGMDGPHVYNRDGWFPRVSRLELKYTILDGLYFPSPHLLHTILAIQVYHVSSIITHGLMRGGA